MEESNYYTPEIEEFRIGFEFELQSAVNKDEWCKCELTYLTDSMFNVKHLSNGDREISVPDCMRVKYLDKEDIESLGFEQEKLPYQFKKNWYRLIQRREEHHYIIEDGRYQDQIFVGVIKNKSELKQLLKQLEIQ